MPFVLPSVREKSLCDFNRNHRERCFRSHLGMRSVSVTSGKFGSKTWFIYRMIEKLDERE